MWDVWLYPHWQVLAWLQALSNSANADVRALAQDLEDQNHKRMQQEHANAQVRLYKASVHKKKAIEGLDWKAMGTHDGKEREAQRSGMQGLWMQFLTPWNNASAGSIQQPSISKTCNWGAGKPSVIFTEYSKPPGFYALFAEHNLPSSNAFFAIPMGKLPKCNEETSLW